VNKSFRFPETRYAMAHLEPHIASSRVKAAILISQEMFGVQIFCKRMMRNVP
jgi:hypothetical protein